MLSGAVVLPETILARVNVWCKFLLTNRMKLMFEYFAEDVSACECPELIDTRDFISGEFTEISYLPCEKWGTISHVG